MSRLWLRVFKNHRAILSAEAPCVWGGEKEALREICRERDLPNPIWLGKHEREFDSFRRTSFLPDHFVEELHFDRMDIEYLDDSGKKRKSDDPRNQF